MNILFDLISTQSESIGGASEYVRKIFYTLYDYAKTDRTINITCVFDSKIHAYPFKDLTPDLLKKKNINITDINGTTVYEIVKKLNIDCIFIGISQCWAANGYSLSNVKCKIITVTHDMHDEELEDIRLYSYLSLYKSTYSILRQIVARIRLKLKKNKKWPLAVFFKNLQNKKNWICVTVSDYSKHSLIYHYGIPENKITILYSPRRIMRESDEIFNNNLKKIISNKVKYYLLVSANRPEKNAKKAIEAFLKYREYIKKEQASTIEPILVVVGINKSSNIDGIIYLPTLSESDLAHAYKYCYALIYPSFFEGFGYPPIEAMKYAKPVLASNVTSIPMVLKDSAIYFSPFYITDIFRAFCVLNKNNYSSFQEKARLRYSTIKEKQDNDLKELIKIITT